MNVPDADNCGFRTQSVNNGMGVFEKRKETPPQLIDKSGAVARDRTVDLVINSHTLYLLSYNGLIPAIIRPYL